MGDKKTKQHGGKRKGAGRHPVSDPLDSVTIYVRRSKIAEVNGVDYGESPGLEEKPDQTKIKKKLSDYIKRMR